MTVLFLSTWIFIYILNSEQNIAHMCLFWAIDDNIQENVIYKFVYLYIHTDIYMHIVELCSTVFYISSVQSLSRVWLFGTPWIAAGQASLSITNFRSSLKLTSIESVMPSSHLILCRPLLLLPLIPPSISHFQWVNSSHEMAKYWNFSFSIILSKEHPGLISFRMDWLVSLQLGDNIDGTWCWTQEELVERGR